MTPAETAIIILASATLLLLIAAGAIIFAAAYWVTRQAERLWKMVDDSRKAENAANDKLNTLLMAELPATPTPPQRYADGSEVAFDDAEDRPTRKRPDAHTPTDADFAAAFGVMTPDESPISAQYETGNPRIPGFSLANGRG